MESAQYSKLFSYLWNIANDVLVQAFEKGDYKKIILPFMVLRRIDVMLEKTKSQVMEKKAFCDAAGLTDYEPFLTPITGHSFYNTSAFTMKTLKNEIDPQRLKANVIDYFNGFSPDVQDIVDKFKMRHWVDELTEKERLGSVLEKLTDASINLSVEPVKDQLRDKTYSVYDGACGTGGILTVTQEEFLQVAEQAGRKLNVMIFGQELQDNTYATCKADLMISGNIPSFTYHLNGVPHQYIANGSTISEDGHAGEKFDFCVSNPPFGTPWKEDLKKWGLGDKKEIMG